MVLPNKWGPRIKPHYQILDFGSKSVWLVTVASFAIPEAQRAPNAFSWAPFSSFAIGVRLPEDVLKQIEKLSKEEVTDRSTTIRKLVMLGYQDLMKRRSAEEYLKGNITFSEAAHRAGLTLWEMEKYLVERGFKSSYSIEDLQKEIKILQK